MEIKLKPGEVLQGIKIFDGIDKKTNLPYCQPDHKNKQIYQLGENKYDGKIKLCENGFHFCLDLASASDYKQLFRDHVDKKYPNALMISPVYYVAAKDKILFEEYEKCGMFSCKYVTNNLKIGRQIYIDEIIHYNLHHYMHTYAYALLDKPEMLTHEISIGSGILPYYSYRYLIQTDASNVTIDSIPGCCGECHNYTIFSNPNSILTITNKTKYVHYVNRYYGCEQYITPVPRYSTVEFKQLDKIGKIVS